MPNSSPGVPGGQHASICLGIWSSKVVTPQPSWGSTSPGVPGGRHALICPGTNSWEAYLPQPDQGFDLQEAVMIWSAWGSAR